MKKFSDLGIEPPSQVFKGDKLEIYNLFNVEIVVVDFKIVPSKFKDKGLNERLDMSITFEGRERVTWTSSVNLITQIKKAKPDDFPFTTTIIKENKGYKFT